MMVATKNWRATINQGHTTPPVHPLLNKAIPGLIDDLIKKLANALLFQNKFSSDSQDSKLPVSMKFDENQLKISISGSEWISLLPSSKESMSREEKVIDAIRHDVMERIALLWGGDDSNKSDSGDTNVFLPSSRPTFRTKPSVFAQSKGSKRSQRKTQSRNTRSNPITISNNKIDLSKHTTTTNHNYYSEETPQQPLLHKVTIEGNTPLTTTPQDGVRSQTVHEKKDETKAATESTNNNTKLEPNKLKTTSSQTKEVKPPANNRIIKKTEELSIPAPVAVPQHTPPIEVEDSSSSESNKDTSSSNENETEKKDPSSSFNTESEMGHNKRPISPTLSLEEIDSGELENYTIEELKPHSRNIEDLQQPITKKKTSTAEHIKKWTKNSKEEQKQNPKKENGKDALLHDIKEKKQNLIHNSVTPTTEEAKGALPIDELTTRRTNLKKSPSTSPTILEEQPSWILKSSRIAANFTDPTTSAPAANWLIISRKFLQEGNFESLSTSDKKQLYTLRIELDKKEPNRTTVENLVTYLQQENPSTQSMEEKKDLILAKELVESYSSLHSDALDISRNEISKAKPNQLKVKNLLNFATLETIRHNEINQNELNSKKILLIAKDFLKENHFSKSALLDDLQYEVNRVTPDIRKINDLLELAKLSRFHVPDEENGKNDILLQLDEQKAEFAEKKNPVGASNSSTITTLALNDPRIHISEKLNANSTFIYPAAIESEPMPILKALPETPEDPFAKIKEFLDTYSTNYQSIPKRTAFFALQTELKELKPDHKKINNLLSILDKESLHISNRQSEDEVKKTTSLDQESSSKSKENGLDSQLTTTAADSTTTTSHVVSTRSEPIGISNNSQNCWFISGLQILCNSPIYPDLISSNTFMQEFPQIFNFINNYHDTSKTSKDLGNQMKKIREEIRSKLGKAFDVEESKPADAKEFVQLLLQKISLPNQNYIFHIPDEKLSSILSSETEQNIVIESRSLSLNADLENTFNSSIYDLKGAIIYRPASKHYLAAVKVNEQWYESNDATITPIPSLGFLGTNDNNNLHLLIASKKITPKEATLDAGNVETAKKSTVHKNKVSKNTVDDSTLDRQIKEMPTYILNQRIVQLGDILKGGTFSGETFLSQQNLLEKYRAEELRRRQNIKTMHSYKLIDKIEILTRKLQDNEFEVRKRPDMKNLLDQYTQELKRREKLPQVTPTNRKNPKKLHFPNSQKSPLSSLEIQPVGQKHSLENAAQSVIVPPVREEAPSLEKTQDTSTDPVEVALSDEKISTLATFLQESIKETKAFLEIGTEIDKDLQKDVADNQRILVAAQQLLESDPQLIVSGNQVIDFLNRLNLDTLRLVHNDYDLEIPHINEDSDDEISDKPSLTHLNSSVSTQVRDNDLIEETNSEQTDGLMILLNEIQKKVDTLPEEASDNTAHTPNVTLSTSELNRLAAVIQDLENKTAAVEIRFKQLNQEEQKHELLESEKGTDNSASDSESIEDDISIVKSDISYREVFSLIRHVTDKYKNQIEDLNSIAVEREKKFINIIRQREEDINKLQNIIERASQKMATLEPISLIEEPLKLESLQQTETYVLSETEKANIQKMTTKKLEIHIANLKEKLKEPHLPKKDSSKNHVLLKFTQEVVKQRESNPKNPLIVRSPTRKKSNLTKNQQRRLQDTGNLSAINRKKITVQAMSMQDLRHERATIEFSTNPADKQRLNEINNELTDRNSTKKRSS